MIVLTCASTGQSITLLGKPIAKSGEGEVWRTNHNGYLAKIYHLQTPERVQKLAVMIAHRPKEPNSHLNHISFAWPKSVLKDAQGDFVGFLMPEIKEAKELIDVYSPKQRKVLKLEVDWRFFHTTALNIASIIEAIHISGYVLGDIKPQNILVNDRALPSIIDTDSFQVRNPVNGKIYRCLVGSEGFTPPELIGKDFPSIDQTEVHDRFRLAVIIYQLLFAGESPFAGKWTGAGETPETNDRIRQGLWLYAPNSLIQPVERTITLEIVHPEVQRCFLRCFNDGYQNPNLRPTAGDWVKALRLAVNELTICGKLDSHYYSRTYGKCYWCDRSTKLGVDIFPGFARPKKAAVVESTLQPQAFAVDKIIERTEKYNPPTEQTPAPITRQKFLQWAGWGGVGLVTGVVGAKIFDGRSPTIVAEPQYIPPAEGASKAFGIPLWTVEFETVTVDEKGQVIKRDSHKQAKFFKEDLGNGVSLEMVYIPGGLFEMGSPPEEKKRGSSESPRHYVNVPAFFMGKFEVTQNQYQQMMGKNPFASKGDNRPVEEVSWYDAVEFCSRLTKHTNRQYRLPSEAEWEYACRAGTTTPFHFGETITSELANYNGTMTYAYEPIGIGKWRRQTTEVGSFPPNSFGLYDMHGNVYEWCQDTWHTGYEGAPGNGSAWIDNDNQYRLLRGGSWRFSPEECRCAFRLHSPSDHTYYQNYAFGFRVVCADAVA